MNVIIPTTSSSIKLGLGQIILAHNKIRNAYCLAAHDAIKPHFLGIQKLDCC